MMGETVESSPGPGGNEEIVDMYNEMFKHRYTDDDKEYVKTRDNPLPNPPCVENWYQRPKRNYDFARGGRGGRGGGYNQGHGDRDRGRDWQGGRDNRNQGRDGGRDRVHYPGRRDDRRDDRRDNRGDDRRDNRGDDRRDNRQQQRYQPYDQSQRHQQGSGQRR